MLERVWRRAVAWGHAARVVVATDDDRIARAAAEWGAQVAVGGPARSGTDRVARIAPEIGCDVVVNLQGDEIDIGADTLDAAVGALDAADVGTVACPLAPEEAGSRDAVKVVCDRAGRARWFSRQPIGGDKHVGVYAFRTPFLREYASWERTPHEIAEDLEQLRVLENGRTIGVALVARRHRSINRPQDLGDRRGGLV